MNELAKSDAGSLYPLRVAARMTGLKPELIRAWETRYQAVEPERTSGGSRRYTAEDLHRLRVLREVVEAGHRIGQIARLGLDDLQNLLSDPNASHANPVERIIASGRRLDGFEVRRLLGDEIARLGAVEFATQIALPLLTEVGRRWQEGNLSIPAEHLTTGSLRSCMLTLIESAEMPYAAPKAIFATPSGEPHDVGTLVAALVAMRAGAEVVFLGADVPAADLAEAVHDARASIVVLGIVTLPPQEATSIVRDLRRSIPDEVALWIGGPGIAGIAPLPGTERIGNLDQLEAQITAISLRASA